MRQRERWPIWWRRLLDDLTNLRLISVLRVSAIVFFALGAIACGSAGIDESEAQSKSGTKMASTDFTVVTPTSIQRPDGWWNPIDEKKLGQIEDSLTGIRMWGNCVWYIDDPTPKTEAAVRKALSDVIDSPIAEEIGLIETADLSAACEGAATVSDIEIDVQDGRQAAMASVLMVDLLDSCVSFYATPDAPLAYRIATTFIDMLWLLELDTPRWPRRDLWGVREWCDGIVEGAVAS